MDLSYLDKLTLGSRSVGVRQSRTKEPYLMGKVLAFCVPLDIAATAAAPKDAPKTKQTNGAGK